jgi:hypothetical protein
MCWLARHQFDGAPLAVLTVIFVCDSINSLIHVQASITHWKFEAHNIMQESGSTKVSAPAPAPAAAAAKKSVSPPPAATAAAPKKAEADPAAKKAGSGFNLGALFGVGEAVQLDTEATKVIKVQPHSPACACCDIM